eukprot:gene20432-27220_t
MLSSACSSCTIGRASYPMAASCRRAGPRVTGQRAASVVAEATAKEFLEDVCTLPGKVRFIAIGDVTRQTVAPNRGEKGELATVSSEDKTFECHVYLNRMKKVTLSKTKDEEGDSFKDEGELKQ